MMINKKRINSVQNYQAYHSLEGILTDHRNVSLRIKLSLRENKNKSNTKIAYNWEHLINNEDLQNNLALHSGTAITYFNMKTLTNLSTTHTKLCESS